MTRLELPFPPSVNTYWRQWKGRTLVSERGREYRRTAVLECAAQKARRVPGAVRMRVALYPPDRRRRDPDNAMKGLLDAIVAAKVIDDDCMAVLRRLEVLSMDPDPDGRGWVLVEVEEFNG